jgi:hypothetical protein
MTRSALSRLVPLLALAAACAAPTLAQHADDLNAVRAPLELYLQGQAEGDGDYMLRAFHPDAQIVSLSDGEVSARTAEEFAALFTRDPAPDESDRHRRIVSLDVTGDVAVAKLELDYPGAFLTDYMTLVRTADGWKILHKAFTRSAPRAR